MKAECTWGEGGDILVSLDGTSMALHEAPSNPEPPRGKFTHGSVTQGSLFLTTDEAAELAIQILAVVDQTKRLKNQCKQHDECLRVICDKCGELIDESAAGVSLDGNKYICFGCLNIK